MLLRAAVEIWPSIVASACAGVSAALAAQTAFVCVLVFVVFFSLGSGPLPFLYMSEILSSEIKGKVRSLRKDRVAKHVSSKSSCPACCPSLLAPLVQCHSSMR